MTANDTTYFLSNPHQWEHPLYKDRWHNTFKFIANTSYAVKRNYGYDEVLKVIERTHEKKLKQPF